MFIELMMPSDHFILCHPHLFLPSMFPSIRVFFNESALPIRWPKYYTVEVTNRSKELLLIEEAPRFHKAYPTSEVRYLTCQAMSLRTFRISATHQDFSADILRVQTWILLPAAWHSYRGFPACECGFFQLSHLCWLSWAGSRLSYSSVIGFAITLAFFLFWTKLTTSGDTACRGESKLVCHKYWAFALEPGKHNYWARVS